MAFIGQAWIMFGVSVFFSQLDNIRKTHNHDTASIAHLAAAFVVAAGCARVPVEAMCRKTPRLVYFIGVMAFVLAFITIPFYYESPYIAYTVGAPLLGAALTATDVSFRCIMPDQWSDRRTFFMATSYTFKAGSSMVSVIIGYYITTVVSWRILFYTVAGGSFVPLLYITYFIPTRLTPTQYTLSTCFKREQTRMLVSMIIAEIAAGGIRWVLPVFLYIEFLLSGKFGERDLALFFGMYLSINFIASTIKEILHTRTVQLGRYAYIVSAVTTGFFSVSITFSHTPHFMWSAVAVTALAGFALGGIDEVVSDLFEEEHAVRVSTLLTAVSGLSATMWFVLLSHYISDDASTPLQVVSGLCVIPAVCMCYASLPFARQKTYVPLAVGTSPA
jgi:hypothetical protein